MHRKTNRDAVEVGKSSNKEPRSSSTDATIAARGEELAAEIAVQAESQEDLDRPMRPATKSALQRMPDTERDGHPGHQTTLRQRPHAGRRSPVDDVGERRAMLADPPFPAEGRQIG